MCTDETAVLADRDEAEEHQAGGAGLAVANDGVLAGVVMLGLHRCAGAAGQNYAEQGNGKHFTQIIHSVTP
ncbi:hypothetical protein D3C73_1423960 [compost metagenome]